MKIFARFQIAALSFLIGFQALSAAPLNAQFQSPLPMREITVGVAVAPSFQKIPQWKDTFKKRLKYSSSILEREFRIRLKEVVFWTWEMDGTLDTRQMLDDLMARYPLSEKNVDIMIGLAKLEEITGSMDIRDLHVLGRTRPFSGYTLLRYPHNQLFRVQEETVLIHEIGHLFGAIHTDNAETIMAPYADRQIPTTFDAVNRQIIALTRSMDFRKGMESLPTEVIQRLLDAYAAMGEGHQSTDFYYALARFYLRLGQDDNALRTLEQVAASEPQDGRVHYDLGVLYFKTGQQEKAQKALSLALGRLNGPESKTMQAQAYNLLGSSYYQEGNMEGAHHNWNKALALDPGNLDIKVNLAIAQLKRGQATAAIHELEKALRQEPENAKILSNLGLAAFARKDPQAAIDYYQRGLQVLEKKKLEKRFSGEDSYYETEMYSGLGIAYWNLNKKQEASQFFGAACQADPSVACRARMAKVYFEIENWDLAIQQAAAALQERKDDPELYGIVGVALTRKGDIQNAVGVFQEGLKHAKDMKSASKFHTNSGHLLLQLQNADLALAEFTSAVSKDPRNRDAHFGMALTYLTKNLPMEARRSLEYVLNLDPGHEEARKLLAQTNRIIEEMQNQQMTFTLSVPNG